MNLPVPRPLPQGGSAGVSPPADGAFRHVNEADVRPRPGTTGGGRRTCFSPREKQVRGFFIVVSESERRNLRRYLLKQHRAQPISPPRDTADENAGFPSAQTCRKCSFLSRTGRPGDRRNRPRRFSNRRFPRIPAVHPPVRPEPVAVVAGMVVEAVLRQNKRRNRFRPARAIVNITAPPSFRKKRPVKSAAFQIGRINTMRFLIKPQPGTELLQLRYTYHAANPLPDPADAEPRRKGKDQNRHNRDNPFPPRRTVPPKLINQRGERNQQQPQNNSI